MRKGAYTQMRNAVEMFAYREHFALSLYNSFPVQNLADTDTDSNSK